MKQETKQVPASASHDGGDLRTKGEWDYQGPKVQEKFGDQTYFTIRIKNSFDIIGFLYPDSTHSPETMKANIEFMCKAVNEHDKLTASNFKLREALELAKESINDMRLSLHKKIDAALNYNQSK